MSQPLSSAWQLVVAAALVGTERRTLTPAELSGPVQALVAQLPAGQPEHLLLASAAALTLCRLASRQPIHLPVAPIAECPPDSWPGCTALAAAHLAQMLAGECREALPEWLAAAAAASLRVPEEYLPALLAFGQQHASLRRPIRQVIGERGRWLAEQNPDWEYAAVRLPAPLGEDEFESLRHAWETSRRTYRLALFEAVRAQVPARAMELLQSTWQQEKADDRASFVAALADGLTLSDEPFLEAALDDRSVEVRRTAGELLARLPASGLCRRMTERARPLLKLAAKGKRRPLAKSEMRLKVTLLEACEPALIRDGVVVEPPKGWGQKAWWLMQVLGAVPPSIWSDMLQLAPAQLVVLARHSEWARSLLEGWSSAAVRYQDPDWSEALLSEALLKTDRVLIIPLLAVLPPGRRDAFVDAYLEANPSLEANQAGRWLLTNYRQTWTPAISSRVIDCLLNHTRSMSGFLPDRADERWLTDIALFLHPDVLATGSARLGDAAEHLPQWRNAVDGLLAVWQFRHAMLKELKP